MNLGDLTVLQYDGPDILSAHFLGRKISFRRVTRSLKTGKFVHNGCMKPSLRLSFRVYNSGVVGIKAICGVQQRTRRVHFKLVRRNADNYRWFGVGPYRHDYQYYDVKTAEEGTLDEFRQEMRSACRPRYVSPTALSYVTFVTDDVIRVRLGETDVVLVKQ